MTKTTKPPIQDPGSMTWPFKLGDKVRDNISGLEGVAISRFFHCTGCDRFAVELPPDGAKAGEIVHYDGNRLELVEAFPDRHREEVPDLHVKLGDKAKAVLHGLVGRVGIIHVPLYGAMQVDISPDWDAKEKKMPEGYFVDVAFVEVVEPYTPRPKEQQKTSPAAKREPGPMRMPRNATMR